MIGSWRHEATTVLSFELYELVFDDSDASYAQIVACISDRTIYNLQYVELFCFPDHMNNIATGGSILKTPSIRVEHDTIFKKLQVYSLQAKQHSNVQSARTPYFPMTGRLPISLVFPIKEYILLTPFLRCVSLNL